MENQEVVHKEGSGVLTWTFISCSISGKTRPSEAVRSPVWYEGTASLHMSLCIGTGRLGMVVVLSPGSSFFPPATVGHCIHSYASGTFVCGAFLDQTNYFTFQWPQQWVGVDISVKEMVPIVMAAALWGGAWSGKHVCFYSATWNTKTAKCPRLMHLMRCFSFYCAFYRFHVSSRHIKGSSNTAADALSRNNMSLFYALVPQVSGCSVPPDVVDLLVARRPDWGSQAWTDLLTRWLAEGLRTLH